MQDSVKKFNGAKISLNAELLYYMNHFFIFDHGHHNSNKDNIIWNYPEQVNVG